MDKLSSSYIRDILIQEMSIPSDRIWIRDQNVKIPNDDDLFIAVGMVDTQIISVRNRPVSDGDNLNEVTTVNARENIQVDIQSRNTDAITRRWEVLAALSSIYAVQVQEIGQFKIFKIPTTFVNSSETEGAEKVNKFSIIIPCFVWYSKEKLISTPEGDWFTTFPTRVDDENTIGEDEGLFEFNASGDEVWNDNEAWDDEGIWCG